MVLSVSPILGFMGVASAADPLPPVADPIGDGNFCEGAPTTEPFTDVQPTDPSFDEIVCLVATGLTLGTTPTTYSPNGTITRRQMALFIKRVADLTKSLEITAGDLTALPAYDGTPDFSDHAAENAAFEEAIGQLSQADIVGGFPDGTYKPGAPVSRRQMGAFINRLQEFLTGTPFTDDGDYFDDDNGDSGEDNLDALAGVGIFQGDGAGNVFPGSALTRRQMANILLRYAQVLFDNGDIDGAFAAGTAGQDFEVTPAGPTFSEQSTAFGTPDGQRSSRTYTADVGSATAVDLALIPGSNVTVAPNGDVTFRDTDPGVGQEGRADGLGLTGCRIETVNGITLNTVDGNDYVNNVATPNGTVTFTFNCETANQFVRPVVFADADNDNQLDLDADNHAAELFGLGGEVLVIPAEALFGEFIDRVAVAPKIIDLFTTVGSNLLGPTSSAPAETVFYDSNDTYTYEADVFAGDPGQGLTLASFESFLSGTAGGQRDDTDLGTGYSNTAVLAAVSDNDRTVFGDVMDVNYDPDPAGISDIDIAVDTPDPVDDVAVAPSDSDSDGSTDDTTVTWTDVINPGVDRFDIFRAPVVSGSIPGDAFEFAGTVNATTFSFNDANVPVTDSPQREFAYIVLAVNLNGGDAPTIGASVNRSPDSNIPQVIMPVVASTARPAIIGPNAGPGTTFTNGPVAASQDPDIFDETDIIVLHLTNGPITVGAGSVIDWRNDDGDLGRTTCGTNATCTVGGPGSSEVTITLSANPVIVENLANAQIDSPDNGFDTAIAAITGIGNANGVVNLAESGVDDESSDIGLSDGDRSRGVASDNEFLPENVDEGDIIVNPAADRVTITDTSASLNAGDTVLIYDRAGTQIASATFPAVIPVGGFPITTSPGFAPGDRLYLVYVDNDNDRLPSESNVLNNPSDVPSVTGVTANGGASNILVAWSESVTQSGAANTYTVYDAANSVLVATGTSVVGSPCAANPAPCSLQVNLAFQPGQALVNGFTYTLRIAAASVQDVNNLPNAAQTLTFVPFAPDVTAPAVFSYSAFEGDSTFEIVFDEPVSGVVAADFFVTGGNTVTAVTPLAAGQPTDTFTVSTGAPLAAGQEVGVSAGSVTDTAGNPGPTVAFNGPVTNNSAPFALSSAVTTDSRSAQPLPSGSLSPVSTGDSKYSVGDVLTITFNEPMDVLSLPASGDGISLSCGEFVENVTEATYQWTSPTTLQITINVISACPGSPYPMDVSGFPSAIRDAASNVATTSPGVGTPDNTFDDVSGPYIISDTAAAALTEFRITFNEPVNQTDAENEAKYSATTNGVIGTTVISAVCEDDPCTVVRINVGSALAAGATISTTTMRDTSVGANTASHSGYVLV